jgi:hypothetical protein
MGEQAITQTTQFRVKELFLMTVNGNFDISMVFEELNIYQNMLTPCMSGSVLIRDTNNIMDQLSLDGNEYIKITIAKGEDTPDFLTFEKKFRINKIPEVVKGNFTSRVFQLHFLSDEYILSEQLKLVDSYSGIYSDFVENILTKDLKIPNSPPVKGRAGIQQIVPSKGIVDVVIPALTGFEAIEWMTNRAIYKTLPDYTFFETQFGYNFVPLDVLYSASPIADINFNPKHLDKDMGSEFLGVRDFKVLSSFDLAKNTSSGVYAGTFFGFDPLTRTTQTNKIDFVKMFDKMNHPNKNPLYPQQKTVNTKYDSKYVVYPFFEPRTATDYVKTNNSVLSERIDNTQDYIFQRKAVFYSLMQRRIKAVLPGNFGLVIGKLVNIHLPNYVSNDGSSNSTDPDMSGKYIIMAVRHIIRYDRHETIIEIATDSTNK